MKENASAKLGASEHLCGARKNKRGHSLLTTKRCRPLIIRPICRHITCVRKQLGKGSELPGAAATQTARKRKGIKTKHFVLHRTEY